MAKQAKKRKPRAWLFVLLLVVLAMILTVTSNLSAARDLELATGPPSPQQESYFIGLNDRPDLLTYFKGLTGPQKLAIARNIGAHDDAQLAKLAVSLLADFDEDVREELTRTLTHLSALQPAAVSDELKQAGGFQRVAVFKALSSLADASLPHVAERLKQPETRANAQAFLVDYGPAAIPFLLAALSAEDKELRALAADGLGKLRARQAVEPLTTLYASKPSDEGIAYVTALAAIGDPASEPVLAKTLGDEGLTIPIRAQAALGLGRIGTPSAVARLWPLIEHPETELASTALSALTIAGDAALREPRGALSDRLRVAATIFTPTADQILLAALSNSHAGSQLAAAEAAANRPALVKALALKLRSLRPEVQGDLLDKLVRALSTTDQGRLVLANLPKDSPAAALAERQRRLAAIGAIKSPE